LQLGRKILRALGFVFNQAQEAAMKFRARKSCSVNARYPFYRNQQKLMLLTKHARDAEAIDSDRRGYGIKFFCEQKLRSYV
jgi:hypothetical protein